jgi:hypothetical protein
MNDKKYFVKEQRNAARHYFCKATPTVPAFNLK